MSTSLLQGEELRSAHYARRTLELAEAGDIPATYPVHQLFINCSSTVHQLFISFPHTGPTPVDPVEFVVSVGSIESSLGTQARMHCAHLCPTFVHCQMLIDSESTPLF